MRMSVLQQSLHKSRTYITSRNGAIIAFALLLAVMGIATIAQTVRVAQTGREIDTLIAEQTALERTHKALLLRMADAALVTSGTATLETALLGVPQLVCYRGNALSVMLARKLIKVKYISLVNLILDREVVTELIQDDLNRDNITTRLASLLSSEGRQQAHQIKEELWNRLGGAGASANAGRIVIEALKKLSKA